MTNDLPRDLSDTEVSRVVEVKHAELYPKGCPLMCEACRLRLGGKRCGHCGGVSMPQQSCECFDNGCQ